MPPTKACEPTRAYWITAEPPPKITKSPTVTWPASITLLDRMTVVADLRVVAHMGIGQEGAAVADDRAQAAALGAGIHGHAFADHAIGADLEGRRLALIFQVLRDVADRGEGEDARPGADLRACRPEPHG